MSIPSIDKWEFILRLLLFCHVYYRARQLQPYSIRALYGISDTRNVGHGSGISILVFYQQIFSLDMHAPLKFGG